MTSNVQPIVAFRQQPMAVIRCGTLQPMVVTQEAQKKLFSKRLNAAMDHRGAPAARGRQKWLWELIGRIVKIQSVQKWVTGKDVPSEPNKQILARKLRVSADYLSGASDTMVTGEVDPETAALSELWQLLTSGQRKAFLELMRETQEGKDITPIDSTPRISASHFAVHDERAAYSSKRKIVKR